MDRRKLKRLQDHWERVLEREGLGDIEKKGMLRVYSGYPWRASDETFNSEQTDAKQSYFELACQFLHSYAFQSEQERLIWELHSQGMGVREIARRIGHPKNYSRLNSRIKQLRRVMLGKTSSQSDLQNKKT